MELKIKATGAVVLTDELKDFVTEKLSKVGTLLAEDPTALAEVELATTAGGARTGDVFRAEINISFSNTLARAEAVKDTLHGALDRAVAEVWREVKKSRGKHRSLARQGAAHVKNFFDQFGK